MNRGAVETRHAFTAEGLSQNDAATAVECDSGNFSRILNGQRLPGRALAVRIFTRFGVPVEWWDEPAPDQSPVAADDDEPTRPELPVLLEERRQSSFPPPPSADFQAKSRDWFDRAVITETDLPPVRLSERERRDTDPDPRAGDVLEPTPKPLTALDRDFE